MAKEIIQFEKVEVNDVDLTDHVDQVAVSRKWDDNDVSALGASAHAHLLGLSDDTITLRFFQDFAASSVHATLGPLAGSNTPFAVKVTKDSRSGLSATNPSFTMQSLLPNYDILNGDIGKPSQTSITFVCGDDNGIVEADS
jgi:hypothetical protein